MKLQDYFKGQTSAFGSLTLKTYNDKSLIVKFNGAIAIEDFFNFA